MGDIIRRKDAMEAMRILEEEDNEMYGCSIPECFDSKRAIEALEKLPSAEPEIITMEELSYQLGCATIQSALYWFEFLKTLDLLGFAIIKKEIR